MEDTETATAYDMALLHVGDPFTVNGSTTGYRRELTTLSVRDMQGQTLDVYGRGIHGYAALKVTGPQQAERDDR